MRKSPLAARSESPFWACHGVGNQPDTGSTAQGTLLKNARERMDMLAAYGGRQLPRCRGDLRHDAQDGTPDRGGARGQLLRAVRPVRRDRGRNYDSVRDLVTGRVRKSQGRISAKRLLPAARAAGYAGPARNFRRLVAEVKAAWRSGITGAAARRCGRRATPWSSTGGRRAGCTCSARCWPGRGSGSFGSLPTRKRPPRWACWPGAPRCWVGCRRRCWPTGWAA